MLSCWLQVSLRIHLHGGKPGPVFEGALTDPDSRALRLALCSVESSKLSLADLGRNLAWTAGLPQELLIWQDPRWRSGTLTVSVSALSLQVHLCLTTTLMGHDAHITLCLRTWQAVLATPCRNMPAATYLIWCSKSSSANSGVVDVRQDIIQSLCCLLSLVAADLGSGADACVYAPASTVLSTTAAVDVATAGCNAQQRGRLLSGLLKSSSCRPNLVPAFDVLSAVPYSEGFLSDDP